MLAIVRNNRDYKETCDEVLLTRGKHKQGRTLVEAKDGSIFNFLKELQNKKSRIEV